MADREEVEPTDESGATESTDAAGSTGAAGPSDAQAGVEPQAGDHHGTEPAGTNPDEFDEIVRGGDFGGSHALSAGPTADDADADSDDVNVDSDDVVDGDRALEPAGVGAAAASTGSVADRRAGRKPKEVTTRRRDEPAKVERTGPVKFVRESVGELRKVVYPTGAQLLRYFVVVLVFVLFIIGYVTLLDLGLGALIFRIFSG